MADPFGIIGVVGVAAQVIKAGVELGLDWKDVPEDSKAFIREVKILQRVLYEVNAHVEKTPGFADMLSRTPLAPTSPGAQAEDIPTLLSTCKDGLNAELDNLRQELQKRSTGHHLGWERVKGAFKSKRTRDAVQDLSRACQNLINSITTGVGIGTWKEVADFRKEHREWQASATKSTGEIKQGAQDREAEELRDRVLRWLSPLDFQTKQNETLSRRQPGTCQWFLDSKEYREWLDATGKTLFCPGIPGAGKTVLASTVINDISFRFEHEPRVVVLFLFFDYQREDEQTLDGLLASLVRQMAQQIPQLPEELGRLYQKHKHSRGPPTAELLPSFTSISHQLSKIYIILDALDECRISEDFRTRFLSQMHGMQRESRFNLLVTSRHIPEIANEVDAQATLEIRAHDADVSRYLDASISGARSKLIKDHREYVTRQISDSVDGMFLLAKLSLDEVKNKRTLANLRRALASLHKGEGAYERAYEQAMGRIREQDKDSRELAEAVLQWMIFPRRRLELKEVQHALAVEIGSSTFDEENIPSPEDMVSVCAGLVTLSPAKCDVDFVHYTTHDYFEQSKDRLFPGAQSLIARTLLTYLNSVISPAIGGMTTDQVGETYPLCSYAVRHWGNHAQDLTSCDPAISRFLQDRTQAAYLSNFNYLVFIANHSSRALFMARPMDRVVPLGPDEPLLPMTLLHYAALFGLEALAAGLLREHAVDQQDRRGRTALHYAAGSGNTGFVRLLMEEKANIGIADVEGMTPLGLAARLHHQTTCQVLCERGANPNSGMIYQKSILMAIFQSPRLGKKIGSETDIARLLIDYGADIDAKNAHGATPLHYAAAGGNAAASRLLMEKGAEVDAKDAEGATPLHYAARSGNTAVARVLIEHGAEVNAKGARGTPLHYAAGRNRVTVARVLIEHGAEVNAQHRHNQTPLDSAASVGAQKGVKVLLQYGHVGDHSGMLETALHLAIRRRYEDIVEILVCAGADLGATAQGGPTALVVALTARVKRSRKYARFLHYNPDTRWTAIFRTLLTQPASSELPFRRRSIAGLPCPLPGQEEDSASKHGCTMPPDSWTRRRPRPWLPATLGSSAAVPSSAVATDSGSLTSLDRGGLEAVVRARLSDEREKPPRRRSI